MSDLISKKFIQEALIERISRLNAEGATQTARELIRFKRFVDGLTPSADRPTGEWVYNPDAYDYGLPAWECDQCGCINANIPPRIMTKDSKPNYAPVNPNAFSGSNYCPNCGARMYKGGDDE